MSSVQQEPAAEEFPTDEKSAWTRPEFARLETGAAEGGDGSGPDNGMIAS